MKINGLNLASLNTPKVKDKKNAQDKTLRLSNSASTKNSPNYTQMTIITSTYRISFNAVDALNDILYQYLLNKLCIMNHRQLLYRMDTINFGLLFFQYG